MWNYDPPPGCHMATCFYLFLLPYIDDVLVLMGSFVGRMAQELEVPIGSMILHTSYVACFRRNNGKTIIATLHLLSSCGRSHLENLSSWERHFMDVLIGGVTWDILGDHNISAQDQQQPHTYHKWREKQHGWKNIISPYNPNTLHEPGVEDFFDELPRMAHFIWMITYIWEYLIGNEIPYACHHSYLEEAIGQQEGFHLHLLMM